jgi:hypothetical protein
VYCYHHGISFEMTFVLCFFAAERFAYWTGLCKALFSTNTRIHLLASFRNAYVMKNPASCLLCGKLLENFARLIKVLFTFIPIMHRDTDIFRVSVLFLNVLCNSCCDIIVPW